MRSSVEGAREEGGCAPGWAGAGFGAVWATFRTAEGAEEGSAGGTVASGSAAGSGGGGGSGAGTIAAAGREGSTVACDDDA